ncbi:MAG: isopentenyl-diphosphate Delta-isomerase [Geminicoccaceae bacterium]
MSEIGPSGEILILIDEQDRQTGIREKHAAHRDGQLHRAFSVLVHNRQGEWLLQRRAAVKYHSGGLWTNACCGHPRPGEVIGAAASRRLGEEMGFACPLRFVGKVRYQAPLDRGMTENELVSIFVGQHDGAIALNPDEADAYSWVRPERLRTDVASNPDDYTVWFRKYLDELWHHLRAA